MVGINLFILHNIVPGKPEISVKQPEEAVLVSWTLAVKNGVIKGYHVTYIRQDDSTVNESRTTQETELKFYNLLAGKTYEFQVGTIYRCSCGKLFTVSAIRYYLGILCLERKQRNKKTIKILN